LVAFLFGSVLFSKSTAERNRQQVAFVFVASHRFSFLKYVDIKEHQAGRGARVKKEWHGQAAVREPSVGTIAMHQRVWEYRP
jgi:hypothetical protein